MEIQKICIFANYNLYESKRYFSQKFAEALRRHGFIVNVVDSHGGAHIKQQLEAMKTHDLTCSFNSALPSEDGIYFWDITHIPHWSILVDPSFYSKHYISSPYSIISCVDHYDCEYVHSHNFHNVFFWPHAVEKELGPSKNQERPYDVVFLGSCYDHENLRTYWQQVLPPVQATVIDEAVEIVLGDRRTSLFPAIQMALQKYRLEQEEVDLEQIVFCVDNYMRGKDRTELIRSIKDAHVHVFGGTCWRNMPKVQGWGHTLLSMPNVTIHPSISFSESLEILKKSKICLNSMPFFKNGTHERIFTGLACGCVPITTDNLWVGENFEEGKELYLYQPFHWNQVNFLINDLLSNENKRKEMAERGRKKVMSKHTWDNRVEEMKEGLKPILERIKSIKGD